MKTQKEINRARYNRRMARIAAQAKPVTKRVAVTVQQPVIRQSLPKETVASIIERNLCALVMGARVNAAIASGTLRQLFAELNAPTLAQQGY